MNLTGVKVAVLVGPGYEDLEFWVPLMRLQEEGAEVTVGDLNLEGATEVAGEISGLSIELDVTDLGSAQAAVDSAGTPLDILVNNAGTDEFGFFQETTPEQWEKVIDKAERALYRETIELGGKLTAEHGIGLLRKPFLPLNLDPHQIEILKGLKVDPAFNRHD